ncbi:MAG: O-antigen ligase family protein [bacterium]|nr:O-antigen ligase family protein [bacterium]
MANQTTKRLGDVSQTGAKKNALQEAFAAKEKGKEVAAGIFAILVLCLFPIIYHDYYFDMIETKYITYGICVGILAVSVLLVALLWYQWFRLLYGEQRKAALAKWKPRAIWRTLRVPDKAILVFWLIEVLSTVTSQYPFEAFWGNEGRYSGLFLMTLYIFAYFAVSRMMKFKRWYLDAFLATAMFVCLFGISDYFGMDLLHFRERMREEQLQMFVSTLGNINTYTAFVAMVSAIAAVLFSQADTWKRGLWYFICMTISFFAIIMGLSDNAYLALAALFGLLPFYLFRNQRGMKSYLIILATFLTVVKCIGWINAAYADSVFTIDGAFLILIRFRGLLPIVLLLWGLLAVWQFVISSRKIEEQKELGKGPRMAWGVLVAVAVLAVLWVLYDCNVAGNLERYGGLSNYLLWNDDWGTHRGYIWRISMENFSDFSFWRKLVGFGPDTFRIVTFLNNEQEMYALYGEIFDNAHNEYLNYLITTGILGVTAYVTFLVSLLVRGFKNVGKNPQAAAMLFAILCYSAQAFVNLNLPIATPVMWMFMMMSMAVVNTKVRAEGEEKKAQQEEQQQRGKQQKGQQQEEQWKDAQKV